ncbi:MAG: fructosamine kinase family protein, partial [Pseudomonadales bacterium]|nr:fructosamine kinase family protein [Pseudomonadales bacterium]
LQPGWEDRMDLYNLYHLLNHLNLFGPSYFNKTVSVIKCYQ